MARKTRQYDPARDNPLLGDAALLIVGAVAGVAGVGYIAYKYGQSSVPTLTPATATKTPATTTTAKASTAPTPGGVPLTPLKSGATMNPGDSLVSPNGSYELIFQTDSNLVLYSGSAGSYTNALWATSTVGKNATTVQMQSDGNCVMYAGTSAVWTTNTAGNPGAYLAVQNDGNLVVYSASGSALWNSGTVQSTS
jgi:hypothetical protein